MQWIAGIRLPAAVLVCVLLLALLSAFTETGRPVDVRPAGDGVETGDLLLYERIDRRVAQGEDYYRAAAQMHREMRYPLRPFYTVRLPTVAWGYALLGPLGLLCLAVVLMVAGALAWNHALAGGPLWMRGCVVAFYSVVAAVGLDERLVCSQELWAGLLLSLALAFQRSSQFAIRLLLVACAVAVRELALPFLMLMGAHAAWQRRWGQVGAVLLVLAGAAAMLALHGAAVAAVTLPGDMASQGWHGLRGPFGFVADLAYLAGLEGAPPPVAVLVTLAPFVGWACHARRDGRFAFDWFCGFALFCALFARRDNYYWIELMLPAYVVGYGLLLWAAAGEVAQRLHRRAGAGPA